ncbi:MAG: EFR1 family ferrodoxin [Lachnospiraceae bacterium]|nr:EFR1 family ferrodoxin [Lachnospiraceae bacterium]
MKIFYFTGTGNSLSVAKRIGGELLSIPQEVHKEKCCYKDDAIGIIFPVYYGDMPDMVRRFLEKAEFESDYLFAVGTYGSSYAAALEYMQELAHERGYQFNYLNALLMVDNFPPFFDMDDEIRRLPAKRTKENLKQLVADIDARKEYTPVTFFGARATSEHAKNYVGEYSSQGFVVDDTCTLCGTCTSVCPAANISITDKVSFSDKCESCYACIHACPKSAIKPKHERSSKRFRNEDVSLKEIIEANKQNGSIK